MIGPVAFVPQPPLLVPALVGGAAARTQPLRDACLAAARALSVSARRWVAIGTDDRGPLRVPATATGTFAGYGVDVPVSLGPDAGGPTGLPGRLPGGLPLPLLIAGWLRASTGSPAAESTAVVGELVHPSTSPAECMAAGRTLAAELAGTPEPVALLVIGDGAVTHPHPGAGRLDGRAGPYDDALRAALADADVDALAGLDADLAAELGAAGRASWQLFAGVALALGTAWRGELLYSAAPYGVAYHVAVWRAA